MYNPNCFDCPVERKASPRMSRRPHVLLALAVVLLLTGCRRFTSHPHSATLSWTASKSKKVVGYNIYRTLQSNGHRQKLSEQPIEATKYVDSTVEGGETYSYEVTSVDANGVEGPFSEPIVVKVPR